MCVGTCVCVCVCVFVHVCVCVCAHARAGLHAHNFMHVSFNLCRDFFYEHAFQGKCVHV